MFDASPASLSFSSRRLRGGGLAAAEAGHPGPDLGDPQAELLVDDVVGLALGLLLGLVAVVGLAEAALGDSDATVGALARLGDAELRSGQPRSVDVDVDLGDGRRLTGTVTGVHGDILIPEDRLKAAVLKAALGDHIEVVAGDDTEGGPFTAIYRAGDRIVGALAVDMPAEVMKYRRLIGGRKTWDDALELAEQRRAQRAEKARQRAEGAST